ncbi:MAG: outer membrane protein assembly factor BamA [Deltaproteobacteria bacterium]|nr:outer membrane protein assembly factor BamA [Deltaproteobacteria bacterium]
MPGRISIRMVMAVSLVLVPLLSFAADENVLLILPFDVHSEEDMSQFKQGIPGQFQEQLQREGINVLDLALTQRVLSYLSIETIGEEEAKQAAEFLEAPYGMYGSLSFVGNVASLDATLVSTKESRPSIRLFAQGKGVEDVPKLVRELSPKIVMYVFGNRRVTELDVEGNKRIEKEAILAVVVTKKGSLFSLENTNNDIKAIYEMGYFEDVRVRKEQLDEGLKLIFEVKENPTIVEVKYVGLDEIKESDAEDAFNVKAYSILNENKLKAGMESLKELYRKDGYLKAEISYKVEPVKEGEVLVVVDVKEGEKIYIRKISFTGNNAFAADDLKEVMDTSEKGILYWLFKTGKLEMPKLENDLENLSSFYQNHGYIRVKVGRPDIKIEDDGIYITIPIEEGPQYRFGQVKLEGDFIKPEEELRALLTSKEGEVYSREQVRADVLALRETYNNEGYAFPDVDPIQDTNDEKLLVNINYHIKKNNIIRFERINVGGNIKTRDKVVRRELVVFEQGLFSAKGLRKSSQNLQRLDFFENVDINTSQGSSEDTLILQVDVTEKKTGNLAVGAGFSSNEGIVTNFEIQERNFMGYGQRLGLSGQIGGKSSQFSIKLTEPWLFDIPLETTVGLFKLEREYDDFTKDSWGGSLSAKYPLYRAWDVDVWGTYQFESADVTDVDEDASILIRDQVGHHTTSAVTTGLRRDTRNQVFLTTEGSDNWISVEYAGGPLGGSSGFVKYILNSGWYFPFVWDTSFFTRGRIGYIQRSEGEELLLYEKFYLGGLNNLRGFQVRKVSPRDPITGDRIGGDKFVFFNLEFRFPIIKEAAIYGIGFFDVGNVYPDDETYDFTNLRRSVGGGIRWYSPLGPLRLEWGYNLAPESDESTSVWDFTIGYGF